jgi:RNA polymerase sigma-70 factor (ECF subfamily)
MHAVPERNAPRSDSELGLMRRVAEGDRRAQRVLAHRLAGRVQRASQRLLSNPADADDAAQLALMEILRSAGTYREEASIERWADRIAVRTILRHAREQRRKPWFFGPRVEADDVGTGRYSPVVDADEATPRKLEQYLHELPAARREVLVMKHALGYTTEEIAELTRKPVGTVKDRLVSARRQLRKLIQRDLRLGARGGRG